ncbi:hypothetical protein [Leclercia sp.]|uniref:hypothetical protein n=1 Tax=Leclercia sp. TaxID=1898428 RepID=UPI002FDD8BF9
MQNGNYVAVFSVCSLSLWERVGVRASGRTLQHRRVAATPYPAYKTYNYKTHSMHDP